LPLWRKETFDTKEPETIEWIDSFEKETVFWDIGANVGVYSLYAALHPSVKVLSFETAASNFYILNKNIEINNLANQIFSLCIAFNKKSSLD
jgi:tRNA1(Val) A37 N6-methylase TrmN6